jgi:SatD family (SatD)
MANYYVVMADVVASRERQPNQLMAELQTLVKTANTVFDEGILSPYTLTLGDEFQGVAKSLLDAVKTILWFEEARLQGKLSSKLRYVVNYGEIDTPLNRELVHGMLGSGLAEARELLNDKRRGKSHVCFQLPNQRLALQLQKLFEVMSSLTRVWKPEEASLLFEMLSTSNNEVVAYKYGKTAVKSGNDARICMSRNIHHSDKLRLSWLRRFKLRSIVPKTIEVRISKIGFIPFP